MFSLAALHSEVPLLAPAVPTQFFIVLFESLCIGGHLCIAQLWHSPLGCDSPWRYDFYRLSPLGFAVFGTSTLLDSMKFAATINGFPSVVDYVLGHSLIFISALL